MDPISAEVRTTSSAACLSFPAPQCTQHSARESCGRQCNTRSSVVSVQEGAMPCVQGSAHFCVLGRPLFVGRGASPHTLRAEPSPWLFRSRPTLRSVSPCVCAPCTPRVRGRGSTWQGFLPPAPLGLRGGALL